MIAGKLFSMLTSIQPHLRCTTQEALNHPWITRIKQNRIPMTKKEDVMSFKYESTLRKHIFLSQFLAISALNSNELKEIGESDYKKQILNFSENIETWHVI